MTNKIFAVVGMCGSGKSEAVKRFIDKGYSRVYFGEVVINEIKERKLDVNEENERIVREDLREKYGMSAMAVKSIDKIRELYKTGNVVIESLYSWSEYKIIKKEFGESFKLIAIHTEKEIRYKRLMTREYRPLNYEQSESRDISEIENIEKGGPICFCDHLIINNSDLENLYKEIDKII